MGLQLPAIGCLKKSTGLLAYLFTCSNLTLIGTDLKKCQKTTSMLVQWQTNKRNKHNRRAVPALQKARQLVGRLFGQASCPDVFVTSHQSTLGHL